MTPMAPASQNANSTINGAIPKSRQLNEVQHNFPGYVMPLVPVATSHDADAIINGTTAFPRSRQLKEVQYDILIM